MSETEKKKSAAFSSVATAGLLAELAASPAEAILRGEEFSVSKMALSRGSRSKALRWLAEGADPDAKWVVGRGTRRLGVSALAAACVLGEVDLARALLAAGADPEAGVKAGVQSATPLWCASRSLRRHERWQRTAVALIEGGADAFAPCWSQSQLSDLTGGNSAAITWAIFFRGESVFEAALDADLARGSPWSRRAGRSAAGAFHLDPGEPMAWLGRHRALNDEKTAQKWMSSFVEEGFSADSLARFTSAREAAVFERELASPEAQEPADGAKPRAATGPRL